MKELAAFFIHMIKKESRLSKGEIEYLKRKGEKTESELFIARHGENQEKKSKYCVIISKKLAAKAVDRNKLRRQIYEAIRQNEIESSGKMIALIPKKVVLEKNYQEIEEDIIKILKNLNE